MKVKQAAKTTTRVAIWRDFAIPFCFSFSCVHMRRLWIMMPRLHGPSLHGTYMPLLVIITLVLCIFQKKMSETEMFPVS